METGKENGSGEKKEITQNEELFRIIQTQNEQIAQLNKKFSELSESQKNSLPADVFAKIMESVSKGQQSPTEETTQDEPDDSDYDEVGVRFCAPYVGYLINGDFRKNKNVKLPHNKKEIFFEFAATRKVQQGRYEATAPFSVYRSKSKKEIQWLREHSGYGTMFFESSNDAANTLDSDRVQRLSSMMLTMKNYELGDLMAIAKDYGVPITADNVEKMRTEIAYKMYDREKEKQTEQLKQSLEDTYRDAALVGKVATKK